MKQEQDYAYNQSLAADRAKVEAEKLRQDEENRKLQKAQMDQDMKEVNLLNVFCDFDLFLSTFLNFGTKTIFRVSFFVARNLKF